MATSTHPSLVLLNAKIESASSPVDIVIEDGAVTQVVPSGTSALTDPLSSIDLAGRSVIPGLWDQHVHFTQWTNMRTRLDLSRATSAAETLEIVGEAIAAMKAAHPEDANTPLKLMGSSFRDGLWPDKPTIAALDAVVGEAIVILVSGDLHCAWLSSAAIASFGAAPPADELFREFEWFALKPSQQNAGDGPGMAEYAETAAAAAARGIVGLTDFEAEDNIAVWTERVQAGVRSLRIKACVWPHRMDGAIERGLKTGDVVDGTDGLVTLGPLKVVVDGSLNTRTAFCHDPYPGMTADDENAYGILSVPGSELVSLLKRAKDNGIGAAIHAIGDEANGIVLDAFEEVGMRGAIEHAQLVDEKDFARFASLGIQASVQPEHAMDDRDVADRHWAGRTARAFAFGSLLEAGAELTLGSDAPVAPLDPWHAISAAVSRSRDGREPWHPEQSISAKAAISASTGGNGSDVTVGMIADLVILDLDPFTASAEELRDMPVSGTLRAGEFTWRAPAL